MLSAAVHQVAYEKHLTKMLFVFFISVALLIGLLPNATPETTLDALSYKKALWPRQTTKYAFSDDINSCLFNDWKNNKKVLQTTPKCSATNQQKLCYGLGVTTALYVSCYNEGTLIPDFTAHAVSPVSGTGRPSTWRTDKGSYKPIPQAAVNDYDTNLQLKEFPQWDVNKQYYCSKGHLTPNAAFPTMAERDLTMIVTNAAPQWQKFNANNWLVVEAAVRNYASASGKYIYVFTGTAEQAKDAGTGKSVKLNKRVVAPKYFWKAICDLKTKSSVVFIAENNVGVMDSTTKKLGCKKKSMTSDRGVVNCYSVTKARTNHPTWPLPDFHTTNCNTGTLGTFLDQYLKFT